MFCDAKHWNPLEAATLYLKGRRLLQHRRNPDKMVPRVLAIGIQHSSRRPPPVSTAKPRTSPTQSIPAGLRSKIRSQIAEAKAAGFDLDLIAVKPSQIEPDLQHIRKRLEKERPDLMIVGFGIRGSAGYTVLLEDLIAACREASPETKIGFNTTFDANLVVCERHLGKQK